MPETPATASEYKWLRAYYEESRTIEATRAQAEALAKCTPAMVDLLMLLPLLQPFSDQFVQQVCLAPVHPHTYCMRKPEVLGSKIQFAFVRTATFELFLAQDRVMELAAATMSHLTPCH
jgi:hypothetical protein